MARREVLNLSLQGVLRPEIALPISGLGVYTVGQFLSAWSDEHTRPGIIGMFDSPEQARHAVAVCANWAGGRHSPIAPAGMAGWWRAAQ